MKSRRLLRFLLPFLSLTLGIVPDDGGGTVDTPDVDTPARDWRAGRRHHAARGHHRGTGGGSSKPASMLEAMFKPKAVEPLPGETQEQAAARVRDEKGRFATAPKDGQPKPHQAQQPGQKPGEQPAKPDPLAMPEGLTPKAQERFQALANTNKELTAKVGQFEPIVQSALELQQTFQTHGVKREQFDQAMQVVGLMNRGDLEGALRVIDEQRAILAMHLGRPVPGADPLAKFPDLREDVDNLRMPEARAIEIARTRTMQAGQQQQQQRQQQEENQQRQSQALVQQGTTSVDTFCKQMMKTDLDYARIEPLLLEQVQGGLLEGVPPNRWAAIVEKTYGLIKQTATSTRQQLPSTAVLRPTGGESPRQTPQTMHEAMWGKRA
jgi:hypothetical protein